MKIPQDVKKLGRHFEKRRPPKNTQSGKEKQPCGYCGQTDTHEEGKNCLAYEKKMYEMFKVQSVQFLHNSKKGNEPKRGYKPPENSKHKRRVKRTSEQVLMTSSSAKL